MGGERLAGASFELSVLPPQQPSRERGTIGIVPAALAVIWVAAIYVVREGGALDYLALGTFAFLACNTVLTPLLMHSFYERAAATATLSDRGIELITRRGNEWRIPWSNPRFHLWVNLGAAGSRARTPAIVWAPVRVMPATRIYPESLAILVTRAREQHVGYARSSSGWGCWRLRSRQFGSPNRA